LARFLAYQSELPTASVTRPLVGQVPETRIAHLQILALTGDLLTAQRPGD
jgi:hypothetical protein